MAKNALDIDMTLPSDAELKRMFDAVPQLRRHDVMGAAVREASKVVAKKARQLAPRSTPEDRAKRSKSQRQSADWESTPMRTTVTHVVRKYERSALGVIGPKHPHGNKAYFNQPRSGRRRHVLWGRDVGRTYIAATNWLVQAFEETKPEQLSKMKSILTKKLNDMWLHG